MARGKALKLFNICTECHEIVKSNVPRTKRTFKKTELKDPILESHQDLVPEKEKDLPVVADSVFIHESEPVEEEPEEESSNEDGSDDDESEEEEERERAMKIRATMRSVPFAVV